MNVKITFVKNNKINNDERKKKNPKREIKQKEMSLMAFQMINTITLKRKGGGEN